MTSWPTREPSNHLAVWLPIVSSKDTEYVCHIIFVDLKQLFLLKL